MDQNLLTMFLKGIHTSLWSASKVEDGVEAHLEYPKRLKIATTGALALMEAPYITNRLGKSKKGYSQRALGTFSEIGL